MVLQDRNRLHPHPYTVLIAVDGAEMLVRFIGRGSYGNKFDPSDPYGIWQILTTTEGVSKM